MVPNINARFRQREKYEKRRLIQIISAAFSNPSRSYFKTLNQNLLPTPVYVPWHLEDSDSPSQARKKIALVIVKLGFINTPAIIVEQSGKILLWYLPDLLSKNLQVR